jgi:hypothetical protein
MCNRLWVPDSFLFLCVAMRPEHAIVYCILACCVVWYTPIVVWLGLFVVGIAMAVCLYIDTRSENVPPIAIADIVLDPIPSAIAVVKSVYADVERITIGNRSWWKCSKCGAMVPRYSTYIYCGTAADETGRVRYRHSNSAIQMERVLPRLDNRGKDTSGS